MKISKILSVMVLLTNLLVNLSAAETAESTVEEVKNRVRKPEENLQFPGLLKPNPKEKRIDYGIIGNPMVPQKFSLVFERTIYIETVLFCFVVLYGILHLPIWVTLYEKLTGTAQKQNQTPGPNMDDDIELVETETALRKTRSDPC